MTAEKGTGPTRPSAGAGSLALTGSASLNVGVASLRYDHRCWKVHWNHVLRAYSALEADYQNLVDRNKMMFDVDAFFIFSTHLYEWMKRDMAKECMLTPEQLNELNRLFYTDPALVLGKDIANTQKHHTRTGGRMAFVAEVSVYFVGQRAEAQIQVVGEDAPKDALGLATQTVASWQAFIDDHKLQPT
ncbi:hypothetical protein LFT48_00350 [Arthrobacter sp. FW305-123]|nr:hypothetical protein LFT48_00350 [Arthrobacter sp. FW305-123]